METKSWPASSWWLEIVITGGLGTPWPITWVFLRLMVSPKCLQASLKRLINWWSSSSEWATTAVSSANRRSRRSLSCVLVMAFSLARLNSFPSDLVLREIPSVEVPNAYLKRTAKNIPNRVGASTHHCLTPLRMSKAAEVVPSKITVPFMSSWKDLMMLRSLGVQSIFGRILKSPSLLTRSKALARSMKAILAFVALCTSLGAIW